MLFLVPIVEGQGEVQAVPALLHRVCASACATTKVRVNPPIRIKAGSFLKDADYFRKYVALAAAKAAQSGGHVIILLDCEDDCPATLGPKLLQLARDVRAGVSILVFLAYREYETWFITAAPSLRGLVGLPDDLEAPADPERIRDAKGWFSHRMSQSYDPIVTNQLDFTRAFDLQQAQVNDSFRRLCNHIRELVQP